MGEWNTTLYSSGETIRGLCQMKYRINGSQFGGNLTPEIVVGGSSTLASLLPCDTTQLDYVNGLTGLFNLMWQTDEVTKTITVEPRDTFFNKAIFAKDWTNKLDKGKNETNKYIYDKLIEWIDKGNNLGDSCHWFKSKMDVDIWFHDNLKVELKIDIE